MVKAVKREDQVAARQKREAAKKAEKAKLIETTRPVPIASDYEEAELNARSIAPLCNDAGAPVAPHLTALKVNQCKWPIGDTREAGFAFCARAIGKGHDVGVSYCPEHRRLAYVPPLKSLEAYISNTTWHADRAA
jgi:hypothetical protein